MRVIPVMLMILLGANFSAQAESSKVFDGIVVGLGVTFDEYLEYCEQESRCNSPKSDPLFYTEFNHPADTSLQLIPSGKAVYDINETGGGFFKYVSFGRVNFLGQSAQLQIAFSNNQVAGYSLMTDFMSPKDGRKFADRVAESVREDYGAEFGDWSGNSHYVASALIAAKFYSGGQALFQMERDFHPLSLARAEEQREPRFTIIVSAPDAVMPHLSEIDDF